jgi:hypothetical protein
MSGSVLATGSLTGSTTASTSTLPPGMRSIKSVTRNVAPSMASASPIPTGFGAWATPTLPPSSS